ncbi:MAG: EamA family transporter [Dehalococcoidia bacterium]|nr:EamA family transporter [Dehalococcoidia bacterium]
MNRTIEMLVWSAVAIVGWGLYGIFAKQSSGRIGMQAIFWTQLTMVLGAVIYLFFIRNLFPFNTDGQGIILGLATGLSSLVAVVALFTLLSRQFPVSIVYPLTALYPLVTVILGIVFLGEAITPLRGLGAVLAVAAIVLLST